MPGKVLRRCDICGNFHAAYIVPEGESGKRYYCYKCWKARMTAVAPGQAGDASHLHDLKPQDLERSKKKNS